MYITDATHFLDEKGAIGPQRGPGRKLADFLGTVIVSATLQGTGQPAPICFKCAAAVKAHGPVSGVIGWQCAGCGESGRITNWEGTLWDMTTTGGEHRARH